MKLKRKLNRWEKWAVIFFATGAWTGFFPIASGTMGSLVGLGLAWWLVPFGVPYQIFLILVLFGAGVWASDVACHLFKKPDSGKIVIDEIVGMMITMIGVPLAGYWFVMGFLVFRVLDIVKLPPANYFDQHLKNGWGVMLDDVLAGIYGNALMHLMLRAQL